MIDSTYHIYCADIFRYDGRTVISSDDFHYFLSKFDVESDYLYAKIGNVYIKTWPEQGVPSDTIAICEDTAEEYSIEEQRKQAFFVANPREMDRWLLK